MDAMVRDGDSFEITTKENLKGSLLLLRSNEETVKGRHDCQGALLGHQISVY